MAPEQEDQIRTARGWALGLRWPASINLRDDDWVPKDTTELVRDLYVHRCRGLAEEPIDAGGRDHEKRYAALPQHL